MQTTKHYIFSPAEGLLTIANTFIPDEAKYLRAEVWSVLCHDRVGDEHTKEELETAFWTIFVAQQIYDAPEPSHRREFRERCLTLGFHSCWTVTVTKTGGPTSELVDEAKEAATFLAAHGLTLAPSFRAASLSGP